MNETAEPQPPKTTATTTSVPTVAPSTEASEKHPNKIVPDPFDRYVLARCAEMEMEEEEEEEEVVDDEAVGGREAEDGGVLQQQKRSVVATFPSHAVPSDDNETSSTPFGSLVAVVVESPSQQQPQPSPRLSATMDGDSSSSSPLPFGCSITHGLRVDGAIAATLQLESANNLRGFHQPVDDEFAAGIVGSNVTTAAAITNNNSTGGFAFDIFFHPSSDDSEDGEEQTILAIGGGGDDNYHNYYNSCPGGASMQLTQVHGHMVLRYVDGDVFRSCRVLVLRDFFSACDDTGGAGVHVAVAWTGRYTSVYRNGEAVVLNAPNRFDTALKHWNPESRLQLFSTSSSSSLQAQPRNHFMGSIQQVSFYRQALSSEQVLATYLRGVLLYDEERDGPIVLDKPETLTNLAIPQDSTSPLEIEIRRRSGSAGASLSSVVGAFVDTLTIRVEFLELPRLGTLMLALGEQESSSNATAAPTTLLPLSVDGTYTIPRSTGKLALEYYLKVHDNFTVPNINARGDDLFLAPETFRYRLVALDDKDDGAEVMAISPVASQMVSIVHVNHPPVLAAPNAATTLDVEESAAPVILVRGIRLDDSWDLNANRVRVDLWADAGRLSLSSRYRRRADFGSCSFRTYSVWQCVGDGVLDRRMTFVAVPDDVNLILEELIYEGIVPGRQDKVGVRVSDGMGGNCLSQEEHGHYVNVNGSSFATIHRGCFQANASIRVPAFEPRKGVEDDSGIFGIPNADLKNFGLADFLFWLVVGMLVCCCCACLRRCPRCLARGAAIDADDGDYDEEEGEDSDDEESQSSCSSTVNDSDDEEGDLEEGESDFSGDVAVEDSCYPAQ